MKFDQGYKDEYLLMRYATAILHSKKPESSHISQMVKLANQMKLYAFPYVFYNYNSNNIASVVKPHLTKENAEKVVIDMNQEDSHFIDSIGISDIDREAEKILKTLNNFYEKGNFEKLNRACFRFLKRIKGLNEYDIHDVVIRYMISTICMADYNSSNDVIYGISQNYEMFDYHIFLFILHLANGQFKNAYNEVNLIKQNICEDVFNLISEEDLAFYLCLCLLLNFEISNYKKVLSQNDTLVYLLYDKYPKIFEIVDDYFKCNYMKVNSDFEKIIKPKILSDPILNSYYDNIQSNFKKKILKEILSFTSEIDFKSIKELIQIDNEQILFHMLKDLILKEHFPIIIDDINKIVLADEKKPINELLIKSNEKIKNKIQELIKFSIKKGIKNRLSLPNEKKGKMLEIEDEEYMLQD